MAVLRRKSGSGGGGPRDTGGPSVGEMTMGQYANGMPNIRLAEFGKSFMRQLPWMIPLIALLGALSWYMTKDIKRDWVAEGRLLVQLGPEFVYNDALATQGSGQTLTPDHIVLTEAGIIKNSDTLTAVINEMKPPSEMGRRFLAGFDEPDDTLSIFKQVEDSYAVVVRPKSSIIDLTYSHEDPEVAKAMLNSLIFEYLSFRRKLFVDGASDNLQERRDTVELELRSVENQIKAFHRANGLADYASERTGVQKRTEDLRSELYTVQASLAEIETSLSVKETQIRALSPSIDLYVEDRAQQRVAQAELELKQLLARYLPGSNPVRAKETELAELKSLVASNGGRAVGGRRVGPNPVYQAAETDRNTIAAQANALRDKEYVLQQQLNNADSKTRKLQNLEPKYQNMLREKASLEKSLNAADQKLNEAIVNQAEQADTPENIKIISEPTFARKGRNMKKILFALGLLASVFTVVMLALLKVFLDPRLYAQPGPGERRSLGYDDEAFDDHTAIPEPVRPYEPPMEEPYRETIPAAATVTAAVAVAEPLAQPYTEPASQNPYLQTVAQNPYEQTAQNPYGETHQANALPVLGVVARQG